jgi:hypothetical protein
MNVNLKEQTGEVLRTLTLREEKIMKMRFGLEDDSEHTLEEVGRAFAVARERISPDRSQGSAQAAPAFTFRQAQIISRQRARIMARARRARRESPGKGWRSICELT